MWYFARDLSVPCVCHCVVPGCFLCVTLGLCSVVRGLAIGKRKGTGTEREREGSREQGCRTKK